MIAFGIVVGRCFDHIAGHKGFAVGVFKLQLGGGADQIQHGIILHVRNLHTDAVSADLLHICFCVALIGQTLLDDGNGSVHQLIEAGLGSFRRFRGILHVHAAAQVQTQRQHLRPVLRVGGRQPGHNPVQAPGRNAPAAGAKDAQHDRADQHNAQRDNGAGFAAALFSGFHDNRILLRVNAMHEL